MSNDLNKMDGLAQAELVASGEASASELVEAAIERIESVNGELNAVITKLYDQARRRAQSDELSDGPFKGVPFLLKDLDAASAGAQCHAQADFLESRHHHGRHESIDTAADQDYSVTLADVEAWELEHGLIPSGAIVLLYTGWAEKYTDPAAYANLDGEGQLRFPGF